MNEKLKELAEQAGLLPMWVCVNEPTGSQMIKSIDEQTIERFAELVRQDEREACAKLCDDIDTPDGWSTANLSASIRARGNHEQD